MNFLPTILCTALGIALMLLPHHRRPLLRDRTLFQTLRGIPSGLAEASSITSRSAPIFVLFGVAAGCLAPLAPAALTLLLALTPPSPRLDGERWSRLCETGEGCLSIGSDRLILALAAPTLFLLAALCTMVLLFSGMIISFGVSSQPRWTPSAHFTVWYLLAAALTAALAAAFPDKFAGVYRFADS